MVSLAVEVTTKPDPLMSEAVKTIGDLTEPAKEATLLLHRLIVRYPPKPAGSKYKRTGKLGRSWKPELVGSGGVLGRVRSAGGTAPYNIYVQDQKQQNPNLKHWQTAQDLQQKHEGDVIKIFEKYIGDNVGDL